MGVAFLNLSPHCPFTKTLLQWFTPWGLWIRNVLLLWRCLPRVKCSKTWTTLIRVTPSLYLASEKGWTGIHPWIDGKAVAPKEERQRGPKDWVCSIQEEKKEPVMGTEDAPRPQAGHGARNMPPGAWRQIVLWACVCPPNPIPVLFASTRKPFEHTDADTEVAWEPSACLTAGPLINNIIAEILSAPLCSLTFQRLQAHDLTVCDYNPRKEADRIIPIQLVKNMNPKEISLKWPKLAWAKLIWNPSLLVAPFCKPMPPVSR